MNVVDAIGSTPLHWSICYGQRSMLFFLLSQGADLNATNDYGMTPLHALVVRGERDLVAALAEKGALINTGNLWGHTPLMTAVMDDDMDMVCLLLHTPRWIESARPEVEEAEEEAAGNPEEDTRDAEEIEREQRRKKRQEEKERKEREALEKEREEQERINAEKWAHHTPKDKAGWTALHHAAALGHAEIVKVLVRCGADKNAVDPRTGETPLHKAILHGRMQCVRYLEGADVSIKTPGGKPLIQVAAMEGYSGIFQWLIEQGADYKMVDANGWTLLHHAAANDHLSIVRVLVTTLGVDLQVKDKEGRRPVQVAHDDQVRSFLRKRMLSAVDAEVGQAIEREQSSLVNLQSANSQGDLLSSTKGQENEHGTATQVSQASRPTTGWSSAAASNKS